MTASKSIAGYELERVLGRGGMGTVYLARHPRLPRSVALKLLDETMFGDMEARARFAREADLAARLDHPNIVAVYDRGVEERRPWIAMQFVDGTDAGAIGILDPARAVRVTSAVAEALDFAHGRGVLHRDVKPANILIGATEPGLPERVMLADFGIARLHVDHNPLTRTGSFTATLAYASPEQLAGLPLGPRSDQYSLACTVFAMITGSAPFAATNPVAVIQSHMSAEVPSISAGRPMLPRALDQVLARAMAKKPEDRFESCGEFAAAVQRTFREFDGRIPARQLPPSAVAGRYAPTVLAEPPSRMAPSTDFRPELVADPQQANHGEIVPGRITAGPPRWWRRRPRLIAVVTAVACLVAGAVVVYVGADNSESPATAEVVAREAATAERYRTMGELFSGLVGQIGDSSRSGFGGANCVRSSSLMMPSLDVTCSSPDGPTFVVKDFGSAADLQRGIEKQFGSIPGTERRSHSKCPSDPATTLIVPRNPEPDVHVTPIVTTFPDDPVRSRYRIDVDVTINTKRPVESNYGNIKNVWWASAPLCG